MELPAPGRVDGIAAAYRQLITYTAVDISTAVCALRPRE
jgi:hypothetical protein